MKNACIWLTTLSLLSIPSVASGAMTALAEAECVQPVLDGCPLNTGRAASASISNPGEVHLWWLRADANTSASIGRIRPTTRMGLPSMELEATSP